MKLIAVATLMMTASVGNTVGAVKLVPLSVEYDEAPALAGVKPPNGTTLVNMDITVKGRSRGEPAVYELRNPQRATAFQAQYALHAKQAGYRISLKSGLLVGVRKNGPVIRLRVIEAEHGSSAILTVKPPSSDPA